MISLSKIVASGALASVLAAGSAYALLSPTGERLPMHNHFAVPFTQGFATRDVSICAIGATTNIAATFENRWNGQWRPVNGDLSRLPRTSCISIWAQGYLPEGLPSTVANAQAINLSTLPLMR
jgi:hypothetical protein